MPDHRPVYKEPYRIEKDILGEEMVPSECYYGIQTLRASRNFDITGFPISHYPELVQALAMVKKAAALAKGKLNVVASQLSSCG